jgi:hypothetical protein
VNFGICRTGIMIYFAVVRFVTAILLLCDIVIRELSS